MREIWSQGRVDEAITALGGTRPDAEQYKSLTTVVLDHPKAHVLAKMDPFSADYRAGVLDLYATLRTHVGDKGYVAERDEASESGGHVTADHEPGWCRGASGT